MLGSLQTMRETCPCTGHLQMHCLLVAYVSYWMDAANLYFIINDEGILPMYQFVTEHCDHWDFQDDDEKRNLWNEMQGMLKAVSGFQEGEEEDDDTWSPLHAIASGVHFIPNLFWSIATEFCENGTYNSDGLLPLHVAVSTPPVEYQGSTELLLRPRRESNEKYTPQ